MFSAKTQFMGSKAAGRLQFLKRIVCVLLPVAAIMAGTLDAEARALYVARSSSAAKGPPKFPSQPNGKFTTNEEDLRVKVPGGHVVWTREYDGNQWKMNSRWMGLGAKFDERPMGGVSVAYGSGTGPGGPGGGVAMAVPRSSEPDVPAEVFGGTGVPGGGGIAGDEMELGVGPLDSVGRNGVSFWADDSRMVFIPGSARYVIKPILASGFTGTREVSFPGGVTATYTGVFQQDLIGGGGVLGWRWQDRTGDWIEYTRNGAITRYGDRNNITVSFEYENASGTRRIRYIRDHNNRAVLELLYSTQFPNRIVEVREPNGTADEPARRVQYEYDTNGCITRVIDARGNSTIYGYDTSRRLTSLTDQEGHTFRVAYGDSGRMSRTTGRDGGVTDYVYDYDKTRKEFFVRISYPQTAAGRRVEERWYDADGQLLRVNVGDKTVQKLISDPKDMRRQAYEDARGNKTEFQRNSYGLVTSVTYADGSTARREFDNKNLNITSETDENGTNYQYTYDERGNLSEIVEGGVRRTAVVMDAEGKITSWTVRGRAEVDGTTSADATEQFEYDAAGNLTRYVDPEGHATTFEFNRRGDITRIVRPNGAVWLRSYDADGNQIADRDPLGNVTRYEFDKLGRQVATVNALNRRFSTGYDAAGREVSLKNGYGDEFRQEFNNDGGLTRVVDATGIASSMEYDASGRLRRSVDGEGFEYQLDYADEDGVDKGLDYATGIKFPTFERRYKFDRRGRVSQKAQISGENAWVNSYTYDPVGQQRSATDANGKTRYFDFNALGQLSELRDPTGGAVRMAYNARGDLLRITDARGSATRFVTDRRGDIIQEIDPNGRVTRYVYSQTGSLTETWLPNGKHFEFSYDLAERITERRQYNEANAVIETVTYGYDVLGQLTSWNTGAQSAVLAYDDDDRLLSETVSYGAFSLAYRYTYYANGQVKTFTGPDNVTIGYFYDSTGELERVSIPGEGDIAVTEWKWSARKKVLLPGGASQEFEYDGLLDMTRMRVKTPGQQTVFELEAKYGLVQEVKEKSIDGAATQFIYDDSLRLTGTTGAATVTYTLDANGNRLGATPVPGTWNYDAAGQLTSKGTFTFGYDEVGNLVSRVDSSKTEPARTTIFRYDALNRLVQVLDGANNLVARYTYDPYDLRLSKEVFSGPAAGTTYYLHAEEGLVAEATAAGVVTTSYGWQPNQDYGTNPLYARVPAASGGGYRYVYYHNDQLGTPQRMTDRSGLLVWSANYDTFGKVTLNTLGSEGAAAAVTNNLRYPGQYFDSETGLHYNFRRYFDPDTGRYITRDPLSFEAGPNQYLYALHNPANFYDPTGEILPCLLFNYLRCVASCTAIGAAINVAQGCPESLGDIAKDCALDCILGMIPIPNPCGRFGKYAGMAAGAAAAAGVNSFTGDTLVHIRGADGNAELKPISEIKVGDQVLAWSEWLDSNDYAANDDKRGSAAEATRFEPVTDIFTSVREQKVVELQLDSGRVLRATAGHPLRTTEGWRDAGIVKSGDRLLTVNDVDGSGPGSKDAGGMDDVGTATVVKVAYTTETLRAFNLEVANAHTFLTGPDGVISHNGYGTYRLRFDDGTCYVGKGDKDRMKQSIKDKTSQKGKHGRKRKLKCKPFWKGAKNDEDSFKREDKWIQKEGGIGNDDSCLLNKRNSPGRRMNGG